MLPIDSCWDYSMIPSAPRLAQSVKKVPLSGAEGRPENALRIIL